MNKFKSAMAALTAILTCISSGSIISFASGTTYDPCDINRDGTVTIVDSLIIRRYLSGSLHCQNYNQLDANQNLTIDVTDAECVQANLAHLSYSCGYYSRTTGQTMPVPSVTGFASDDFASSYVGRSYMRYSFKTNQQLSNYSLMPTDVTMDDLCSTRSILDGVDNRYLANGSENSGLVRVGDSGGTGFIIGDHMIATAAHCVYKKDAREWYNVGVQTYNADGSLTGETLTPVEAHIPYRYQSETGAKFDYALITVEEDLSEYVHFNLAGSYNVTTADYSNIPIYITGCPSHVFSQDENKMVANTTDHLYSAEGRVHATSNTYAIDTDIYISGGDSGSPMYTIMESRTGDEDIMYSYSVLGICSGYGVTSYGCLITKYQLQFYKNNPYVSH